MRGIFYFDYNDEAKQLFAMTERKLNENVLQKLKLIYTTNFEYQIIEIYFKIEGKKNCLKKILKYIYVCHISKYHARGKWKRRQ